MQDHTVLKLGTAASTPIVDALNVLASGTASSTVLLAVATLSARCLLRCVVVSAAAGVAGGAAAARLHHINAADPLAGGTLSTV